MPLGSRVHKYDKKYPPHCPSCHDPKENWEHFWRCQTHARLTWRRQFLKDLNQKLIDLKTGPEVRTLLVEKLRAVLDGKPTITIPVDSSLEEIGTQQDQIGWDQIMQGRLGWAWQTHARTQPDKSGTKGNWTSEVISFIFNNWWKLWESRNQDRHGRDLATRIQTQALQTDRELAMFYEEFSGQVPQELSWILDTSLETHRKRPTAATRQWLNTWRPIVEDTVKVNRNPEGDPNNPENYPYSTALETG